MSYYANGEFTIQFKTEEDKVKFNEFLLNNKESADFIKEITATDNPFPYNDGELEYFFCVDGNYHEEDQQFMGIVLDSGIDCLCETIYEGEGHEGWKLSNKTGEFVEENKGFVSDMSVDEIIKYLTPTQSDELLKKLRIPYIKEDVLAVNENIPESVAEKIAESYLEGRYDCNLSYWDNIANLIDEHTDKDTVSKKKTDIDR